MTHQPIFILGSPRSGTTFAISLLNAHSDVFGFNETLFYEYIQTRDLNVIESKQQLDDLQNHLIDRLKVRTVEKEKNFGCIIINNISLKIETEFLEYIAQITLPLKASAVLDNFMAIAAKHHNKTQWAEKTPNHVFYIDKILNDFPNAKLLHISRDPYAYLLSYKFSPYTHNNKTLRGKLYHPIITSILWNNAESSITRATQSMDNSQILSIRYEDLANDTPTRLKEICAFINIPYEETMINIEGSNSSFKKKKKSLSIIDSSVCGMICKKNILKNNYIQHNNTLFGVVALLPAALTLPIFFFRALTSQRSKIQGSLKHYIKTRLFARKN